jgi:hypothetical protein
VALSNLAGMIVSKLYSFIFSIFLPGIKLPQLPLPSYAAKKYYIAKRLQSTLQEQGIDFATFKGHLKLGKYKP